MDYDILRRIAERGLAMAVKEKHSRFVDMFQHMLDEIQRARKYGNVGV